jgi:anti-sigma regulatory factor (Ser/Thr protein kinase)
MMAAASFPASLGRESMLTDRGASADVTRNGRDEVTLELPADSRFLGALRGMARALAAQGDLTADGVEDVQMAIDEAFVLLIPLAEASSAKIGVGFAVTEGQIDIELSLASANSPNIDRGGLSWTVLEALADELDVVTSSGQVVICFTKRREPA